MEFFKDYNSDDYEDASFDPIPAGQYKVICDKIEEKKTKAGTGSYLNCSFQVIEGEYKERLVFQMFNIDNPSEKAQKIGRQQLSSFCRAINVPKPKSEQELLNIPLVVELKIRKDEEYGDKNEIKKFIAIEGATAQATSTTKTSTPPWKK